MLLILTPGWSQWINDKEHPLFELEKRLKTGDKDALFEIAFYFDSKAPVRLFIDAKYWTTNEDYIARNIVKESCHFLPQELIINSVSSKQFFDFLSLNRSNISFSKSAESFLLTALEVRAIQVDIRTISALKKLELREQLADLMDLEWVKNAKIDSLIKQKNPLALLSIASEIVKNRQSEAIFIHSESFLELLRYLTHLDIGVKNKQGETSWLFDNLDDEARFNYLIYFIQNYQHFHWDEQLKIFVNPLAKVRPLEQEEYWFQLLENKNDSLAIDAFIRLTTSRPEMTIEIANEYFDFSMVTNNSVPIFPCSFLKQLVVFTAYCRERGIDYTGTKELKDAIVSLSRKVSDEERKCMEDELIKDLTLDEITAFEYWTIVYQNHWEVPKSAKRVLDAFYQKHWSELLANENQLEFHLRKARFFRKLEIRGYYNNYLKRFKKGQLTEVGTLMTKPDLDVEVKSEIAYLVCCHLPKFTL